MDAEVEADTGLATWGSGKVGLELGIGKGGGGTPGRGKANLLTEFQAGLGEGYGSLTGKLGGGYWVMFGIRRVHSAMKEY